MGNDNKRAQSIAPTKETPKFIIESDASIVAPLMFAYILGQ